MSISVTLSANAGVSLWLGDRKIWVDALHDTKTLDFSPLTPPLLKRMEEHEMFQSPDIIFVTHCHLDHYSRKLVGQAAERWPEARLVLPQREFPDQLLVTGESMEETICGVDFRFFELPHEDVKYEEVPHYGAVISRGGFSVLVTGDCAMASPVLAERIRDIPIDLALVDFPWITLRKGREFIQKYIAAKHLLVYHLPFREEDRWGYRAAAERSVGLLDMPDVRLLYDPLQTERF